MKFLHVKVVHMWNCKHMVMGKCVGLEVFQQQPLVLNEQTLVIKEKSQFHQFPGFIQGKSTSDASI